MAEHFIKLTDLHGKDQELESELSYAYDLEHTITDLKQTIAKNEGYTNPEQIKLYFAFEQLPNEVLVKDIAKLDDISVEFPQYAMMKCDGGETFIFWKTFLGKRKWLRLFPGCQEAFKVPRSEKFAVMRNK